MATFTVRLQAPVSAAEAWRRVWNLDAHTRLIPLTRLSGDGTGGERLGVGDRFVARTGVGPVGFDDVMTVTSLSEPVAGAPGRARLEKSGRVVKGSIDAEVVDTPTGSTLTWVQDIGIAGVPSVGAPVVAAVARAAYARVLRQLLSLPVD